MQDGQAATPLRPNRFTSATVEPIGYPGSVRLVKRRMGTEEVGKADEALFEEQYRSSTSQHHITYHTYVHENIKRFVEGFRYDAHPMTMLTAGVAALSSFYPSAKDIFDPVERDIAFIRMLAKMLRDNGYEDLATKIKTEKEHYGLFLD